MSKKGPGDQAQKQHELDEFWKDLPPLDPNVDFYDDLANTKQVKKRKTQNELELENNSLKQDLKDHAEVIQMLIEKIESLQQQPVAAQSAQPVLILNFKPYVLSSLNQSVQRAESARPEQPKISSAKNMSNKLL